MSSIIYLGQVPSSSQVVAPDLSSKGINLVRAAPGEMNLVGLRTYDHPSYVNYCDNFALAVKSVMTNRVLDGEDKTTYYTFKGKDLPPFCVRPDIIWTYGDAKPEEFLNQIKSKFGAYETTAGGKPALCANLSRNQVAELIKSTSPLESTDFSMSHMNIRGYKVYVKLMTILHAFCKIHQYALTMEDTTASKGFQSFTRFGAGSLTEDKTDVRLDIYPFHM